MNYLYIGLCLFAAFTVIAASIRRVISDAVRKAVKDAEMRECKRIHGELFNALYIGDHNVPDGRGSLFFLLGRLEAKWRWGDE